MLYNRAVKNKLFDGFYLIVYQDVMALSVKFGFLSFFG